MTYIKSFVRDNLNNVLLFLLYYCPQQVVADHSLRYRHFYIDASLITLTPCAYCNSTIQCWFRGLQYRLWYNKSWTSSWLWGRPALSSGGKLNSERTWYARGMLPCLLHFCRHSTLGRSVGRLVGWSGAVNASLRNNGGNVLSCSHMWYACVYYFKAMPIVSCMIPYICSDI